MTAASAGRQVRALYICYLSLDDPLTHTQVVAYLKGLARAGHAIHLLTFEPRRLSRSERTQLRGQMAQAGISWHHLRYHKRPSLPATAYDTLVGALYACWLSGRHRLNVFHARSHVPAAMSMLAGQLLRRRTPALIFDIRGLMGEEYVDAGRWRPGGAPFRLVKAVERSAIERAAGIVVLTERVREQLFGTLPTARVFVIPCCADLGELTAHQQQPVAVDGIAAGATVMVYVGKLEGWYMAAEMADFFATARRVIPDLHFMILTQGTDAPVRDRLEQLGCGGDFTITSALAHEVGGYLATADFGVSFIRPAPSKASSSPTKVGEYLAAGLPVLATSGVGDLDSLLLPGVGVLVNEHTDEAYIDATNAVLALLSNPDVSQRCREVAQAELSLEGVGIPRYLALYAHVAQALTSRAGAGTPQG